MQLVRCWNKIHPSDEVGGEDKTYLSRKGRNC